MQRTQQWRILLLLVLVLFNGLWLYLNRPIEDGHSATSNATSSSPCKDIDGYLANLDGKDVQKNRERWSIWCKSLSPLAQGKGRKAARKSLNQRINGMSAFMRHPGLLQGLGLERRPRVIRVFQGAELSNDRRVVVELLTPLAKDISLHPCLRLRAFFGLIRGELRAGDDGEQIRSLLEDAKDLADRCPPELQADLHYWYAEVDIASRHLSRGVEELVQAVRRDPLFSEAHRELILTGYRLLVQRKGARDIELITRLANSFDILRQLHANPRRLLETATLLSESSCKSTPCLLVQALAWHLAGDFKHSRVLAETGLRDCGKALGCKREIALRFASLLEADAPGQQSDQGR